MYVNQVSSLAPPTVTDRGRVHLNLKFNLVFKSNSFLALTKFHRAKKDSIVEKCSYEWKKYWNNDIFC